ncbi:hypothetical protein F2Q70_00015572 [Brassica cretica]|uniref:Uncharacterized protein n=1 Tax=Brassica cretica TaxID=69181 RepID=A0A8S9I077_BRACR|nr:hypothetical protein F2Q70_00015572 [Brassica cretica]KAF2600101.1 hypothetical protein F2Q68_00008518 [Brassica cretica]
MATTRVDFPALARRYVFSSYVRRVCDTASLDPAWKLRNRHRESSHQPPRSRAVSSSQSGSRLTDAKLNRDQASSTASSLHLRRSAPSRILKSGHLSPVVISSLDTGIEFQHRDRGGEDNNGDLCPICTSGPWTFG